MSKTELTADEVTLGTIRYWMKRMTKIKDKPEPGSHAAGFMHAIACIQAILDVHGQPEDTPVHFPAPGE